MTETNAEGGTATAEETAAAEAAAAEAKTKEAEDNGEAGKKAAGSTTLTADGGGDEDGAKKEGEESSSGEQTGSETVPDEYKFDFPDGQEIDQEVLTAASKMMKEAGLSQAQATAIVNYDLERAAEAQAKWAADVESWKQQVRVDPELGGRLHDATTRQVQAAFKRYGDDELAALMEATGLGEHPAVIRCFKKVYAGSAEDTSAGSKPVGAGGKKTEEERLRAMYPTMGDEFFKG